jgi:predicted site-specific integrase-resolvase
MILPTARSRWFRADVRPEVDVNPDARLRPADAARVLGVSKQLVNWWRRTGKIQPDQRGRYRLGDVQRVERQTAGSKLSTRHNPARVSQAA